MNNYNRVFGAGPRGLSISIALFITTYYINPILDLPKIHDSFVLGFSFLCISTVLTLLLAIWSFISLNPKKRGRELVTTGAFRYFRHPLYAALLTFFNFGLSLFLDNYIYVIWAAIQHPIWHLNVMSEEKMIEELFPIEYEQYCLKTGRFIPKLRQ